MSWWDGGRYIVDWRLRVGASLEVVGSVSRCYLLRYLASAVITPSPVTLPSVAWGVLHARVYAESSFDELTPIRQHKSSRGLTRKS